MIKETKVIENINYILYKPENEIKQVLICVHGFAGDSESSAILGIAKKLTNENVIVITFDLPCHGKDKKSELSLDDCFDYLNKVIKYVQKKYDYPISFFATSFGGYLLLKHLENDKNIYKNVLLRAPAIYMDEILKDKILPMHNYSLNDLKNKPVNLGFENKLLVNYKFYSDLKKSHIKKQNRTIFVIQGKKDEIVDYKKNKVFFNSHFANNKIKYLENADHRFKKQNQLNSIIKFVESKII